MPLFNDLTNDVQATINAAWTLRKGRVVPSTATVNLAGGAVELDATFLYADLADSSKIAKEFDRRVAAKIIKSFLATTARVIKHRNGTIVSFDGDRILGVFIGGYKNSNAAIAALHIAYVVNEIIRKRFENKYPSVKAANFRINHGVGIDTGSVLIVCAGARGDNDLVSIGRAPNLAAKMSDFRDPFYQSFITESVYNRLSDEARYGGIEKRNMWEARTWTFLGEAISVYRSNWQWAPY